MISISDPVPFGLAAAAVRPGRRRQPARPARPPHLAGDRHRTGRATPTASRNSCAPTCSPTCSARDPPRAAELHATAARWWADQDQPINALDHATAQPRPRAADRAAAPLRHAADPRRATTDRCAGRWPGVGAPGHRVRSLAGPDLRADPFRGRRPARGPGRPAPRATGLAADATADGTADLTVLRAVAEQLGADQRSDRAADPAPFVIADLDELPAEPELEALARLSRGSALLERDDRAGARAELDAALDLSRRHGFDYLTLQCLALLGVIAGTCGDVRTMRAVSSEALAAAADHGWQTTTWSAAATAMLAYAELLRSAAADAQRLTADALASAGVRVAAAAVRAAGRPRCRGLRPGRPGGRTGRAAAGPLRVRRPPHQPAAVRFDGDAGVPRRPAARARRRGAHRPGLADRTHRRQRGDLLVMRGWAETAGGHHEHAARPDPPGPGRIGSRTAPCTPSSTPGCWKPRSRSPPTNGPPPAARCKTPSPSPSPSTPYARSSRPAPASANCWCTNTAASEPPTTSRTGPSPPGRPGKPNTILSERELTVLGLLPSMLSLDEIATDLTVSVNTVKSHVRSIYAKLGVSSRRLAVLAAHEHGLLNSAGGKPQHPPAGARRRPPRHPDRPGQSGPHPSSMGELRRARQPERPSGFGP